MAQDSVTAETSVTARAAPPRTVEATGLSEAEAVRRLAQYGENALVEHRVSAV